MSAAGDRGSRRGPRELSEEDRALWSGIARLVKPLRGRAPRETDDGDTTAPPARAKPAREPAAPARPARPAPPPLAALARRERQKLARGGIAIDERIDLHGMSQGEAHVALARFLRRAQAKGARFVLVITGKGGAPGVSADDRGVLRRQVPLWLGLPEFRDTVVGFEAAHAAHGGAGALYVRIRRGRSA